MMTLKVKKTSLQAGTATVRAIAGPLFVLAICLSTGCHGQTAGAPVSPEDPRAAGSQQDAAPGTGFVEPGSESLDSNLLELARIEPYLARRDPSDGFNPIPVQPLPKEFGAEDLDKIIGNPTFHNVYGQLRALPEERAAALVSAEIAATLQTYLEQYEHDVNRLRTNKEQQGELPPGTLISAGLTRQTSDNKDGTPTLHGLRYKLLGLVWCAGALELDGTDNAVQDVAEHALEQRARCYEDDAVLSRADRMLILTKSSLYNRQILATALLAVSLDAGPSGPVETDLDITWKPYPLSVSASIQVARYENRTASELREARPAVPSDSVSTVDAISDDEFDAIAARVGLESNP